MNDFRELAKLYKSKGLTVIPVDSLKQPTINWTKYQTRTMSDEEIDKYFKNCYGIGLLMGGLGKLEAVDIDSKYSLCSDFVDRLKEKVPVEILEKLWVQKTPSGGFHWIYQTDKIEPNQKLANRETTEYEKHEVYIEAFSNPNTRKRALKIASNHKSLVLIETRGGSLERSAGFILIAPTKGYEKIYGKINKITVEERDTLIEICRSFNEYSEPIKDYKQAKYRASDINPFDEYNERANPLDVLSDSGWEIISESSHNVRLRRPGSPNSQSSALYDKETKVLNVFSTSTSLECNKGYSPSSIFIELECNGDTQLAFNRLIEMGYGEKE